MKASSPVLAAVLLASLVACGLVSPGLGVDVSESEAREAKTRLEANFDEAMRAAIRSAGDSKPRGDLTVYRVSCSDFTPRDISLEMTGGFIVTGQTVPAVAREVRRGWGKKGWIISSYDDPTEVLYRTSGERERRNVGSVTVTKLQGPSGGWMVDVQLTATTTCMTLPESLYREGWPTKLDDS